MALDPEELKRLMAEFSAVNADPEADAQVAAARDERRQFSQGAAGSRVISDLTRAFMPIGSQGPGYGQADALEKRGDDVYAEAQGERGARAAKRQAAYPLLNQYMEGRRTDATLQNAKEIASAKAKAEAEEKAAAAALSQDQRSQDRQFQAEQKGLDRASHERSAALMAGSREKALDAKHDAAASKSNVYGRDALEGATPTEDDKKHVLTADTTATALKSALANLDAKLQGTSDIQKLMGDEGLKSAYQQALDQYRTLAGLGVPSGPDTQLMANALADPTSLANVLRGRGKSSLAELHGAADRMVDQVAGLRGYGPRTKGPGAAPAAAPVAGGQRVKMLDPNGKPFTLDASEVEEAKAHGWKVR